MLVSIIECVQWCRMPGNIKFPVVNNPIKGKGLDGINLENPLDRGCGCGCEYLWRVLPGWLRALRDSPSFYNYKCNKIHWVKKKKEREREIPSQEFWGVVSLWLLIWELIEEEKYGKITLNQPQSLSLLFSPSPLILVTQNIIKLESKY